jgi:uncharacterized protein (UPF0333 family)
MLQAIELVKARIGARLNEKGQAVTEYVLLILGVVLFLIAAAFVLKGSLTGAVSSITSWITSIVTPAAP